MNHIHVPMEYTPHIHLTDLEHTLYTPYIHPLHGRYGVNGAGDQSADDKKRDEDREMKRRTIQVRREKSAVVYVMCVMYVL